MKVDNFTIDSSELHAIDKSSLKSKLPNNKQKLRIQNDKTKTINVSPNSDLQREHSCKKNIHSNKSKKPYSSSDRNRDKRQSAPYIDSKYDLLPKLSEIMPSNLATSAKLENDNVVSRFISASK